MCGVVKDQNVSMHFLLEYENDSKFKLNWINALRESNNCILWDFMSI